MTELPERVWYAPSFSKHYGFAHHRQEGSLPEYVRADTLPASPAPVWLDPQGIERIKTLVDGLGAHAGGMDLARITEIKAILNNPVAPGSQPTEQPPQADALATKQICVVDCGKEASECKCRAWLDTKAKLLPPQADVQGAARVLLAAIPNYAMERAALESRATDDEGQFESLSDLLDFSGQNKSYTVIREAICAALRALAGEE